MRNKFRDADLAARLGSSILRWKGHPYHCEIVRSDIYLYDIPSFNTPNRKEPIIIKGNDPYLDISSITLGYFNIEKSVVYLARNPLRRYKQGVDFSHLEYRTLDRNYRYAAADMYCQGFVDGCLNKYPSVNHAMQIITGTGKINSRALSNDVALLRDKDLIKIHVKGEEVAWMRAGTNRVIVPPTETSWITVWILKDVCRDWDVVEGLK